MARDYAAINKDELCEELHRKDAEIERLRTGLNLIGGYPLLDKGSQVPLWLLLRDGERQ